METLRRRRCARQKENPRRRLARKIRARTQRPRTPERERFRLKLRGNQRRARFPRRGSRRKTQRAQSIRRLTAPPPTVARLTEERPPRVAARRGQTILPQWRAKRRHLWSTRKQGSSKKRPRVRKQIWSAR